MSAGRLPPPNWDGTVKDDMKESAIGCGIFVALFGFLAVGLTALSIGGMAFGYAWDWYTAPLKGAQDARQIIQADGEFRIDAYNTFYNACTSIEALERDVDLQISRLATAITDNEKRIINDSIVGIAAARDGAVARYNNDSHKQWTIAQFKSKALVYEISNPRYLTLDPATGAWKTGAKTTCVVS